MQESLFALWIAAFGTSVIARVGFLRLAWLNARDNKDLEAKRRRRDVFWDDYFDNP